jgi:hypothetical protein
MVDEAKDKVNVFYLVIVSIVAVVAIVSMVVFFAGMRKDSAQVSFMPAQASGFSGQNQYAMPMIEPLSNGSGNSSDKNVAGYQSINPSVYMYYQSSGQYDVNKLMYCYNYRQGLSWAIQQCDIHTIEAMCQMLNIVCSDIIPREALCSMTTALNQFHNWCVR